MRSSIMRWPGVVLLLVFWSGPADLIAQPVPPLADDTPTQAREIVNSLEITVMGPKNGYVDQPILFQVRVVNPSDRPTPATELRLVAPAENDRHSPFKVDALKPKESRIQSLTFTPTRTGSFDVLLFFEQRSPTLQGAVVHSIRSMASVQIGFDPKAPVGAFLPAAPKEQASKPRLASTLEQVPEVAFEDRLNPSMPKWQVHDHLAATIEKINHLSQKKTDAYMQNLLESRPDLAGLPFAMGDACRMKPDRRQAFSATVSRLREPRREGINVERIDKAFPAFASADSPRRQRSNPAGTELGSVAERSDIAGLTQVLAPENEQLRAYLVYFLTYRQSAEATRSLARLAIFSEEASVRNAALDALKDRPAADATDILLQGLSYPWPAVAQRASSAIVKLERVDLIPQLRDMLDRPDPRTPEVRVIQGKKVHVVRELVRINHHRNCLLCHAPGTGPVVKDLVEDGGNVASLLTAPALLPNVPFPVAYYNDSARPPDILVRVDVTYLRQDFSTMLHVQGAAPWPDQQRFDFLVRTREVSAQDAQAYQDLLRPRSGARSPYHDAAMTALSALASRPED